MKVPASITFSGNKSHIKGKTTIRIIICLLLLNWLNIANAAAKSSLFQTDPFAILKGYKRVSFLRGKSGELLGYVYVKEDSKYTNGVLADLLVVRERGAKLDTLYQINSMGFFNSKRKLERKYNPKSYYGFKLYKELHGDADSFAVGKVDSKGRMYSDDNNFLVDWNYENKAFEYYPAP